MVLYLFSKHPHVLFQIWNIRIICLCETQTTNKQTSSTQYTLAGRRRRHQRLALNANADNCVIQLLFKAAPHPTGIIAVGRKKMCNIFLSPRDYCSTPRPSLDSRERETAQRKCCPVVYIYYIMCKQVWRGDAVSLMGGVVNLFERKVKIDWRDHYEMLMLSADPQLAALSADEYWFESSNIIYVCSSHGSNNLKRGLTPYNWLGMK